jgi:TonB-linked SusC/RagA family outer membrane protein
MKNKLRIVRLLGVILAVFSLATTAFAQTVVKGSVNDAGNNQTLPGATVKVTGTNTGTTTDIDGKYSLSVPANAKSLTISFVGYLSEEVAIGTASVINVTLTTDAQNLEGVIVVGYGSQKKSDLTGAIVSVKGKDLTTIPTQQVAQSIQGRAAGVWVLNASGAPGSDAIIRIRGMNSVNGGNNALIVIDGMQGGTLSSLNPNDVESMEILKDASATAIYGSRGANGVVLITTKKGKKGKPMVDYGLIMGTQSLRHKIDLMSAGDYARSVNLFKGTQDGYGTPPPIFTDAEIAAFDKNGGTDWQDQIFRNAPLLNNQLTVSGATDKVNYLVSGGFINQQGILTNSEYKRYSLRTNLGAEISKVIHFDLFYSGSWEKGNIQPVGDYAGYNGQALNTVLTFNPTTPPYDSSGNYILRPPAGYGAYDSWNPLASAKEPKIENSTVQNNVNTNLDFKILDGLTLRITGGANIQNTKNKSYFNSNTAEGQKTSAGVGVANYYDVLAYNLQNSNILTYDHMFGTKHHLTFTGVAEQQYGRYEYLSLTASGFAVDLTGANDLGGASMINSKSSNAQERVINSFLGRVNYVYDDKYMATLSYRADGSSVFGANNRWGYFPSVSVAWRLSQESFIKDMDIFSNLKLRASIGTTGNQAISPYQTLANMTNKWAGSSYGNANYPYNGTSNTDIGMIQANIANPNLKWESTKQSNIGLDFGLFKGRLTATVEYYYKVTSDLLLNKAIPYYTGFSSMLSNVGSMENKGFEFTVGGDPFVGKFSWNTNLTVSTNKNKVLDLGDVQEIDFVTTNGGYDIASGFMQLRVGESFGDMYGYGFEGIWKTSQAAEAAKYGQIPGTIHWTDANTDGKINSDDVIKIGHSQPKFTFGWNNSFNYGNFDLTIFIQGSKGNQVFNLGRIRYESQYQGTSSRLLNSWTPTNENTDLPGYIKESTWNAYPPDSLVSTVSLGGDAQRSQRWVEDASYIRVKNISLGYTIPSVLLEKVGIRVLKVYVSATNLITFTNYSGYDPEVSSYNSNDAMIGVDQGTYPTAKTINFGLNLTF